MSRERARLHGVVQGVGFRPFAYREARRRELAGWVRNRGGAVELEVEGPRPLLDDFFDALSKCPAPAQVERIERAAIAETAERGFSIQHSTAAAPEAALPADLAPCADCERELRDPHDRRFAHPFASCALCGPRFSIVLGLPYDRERTTMAGFALCPECRREYEDPLDRRYHAEPIACPRCGPQLSLLAPSGGDLGLAARALQLAAQALRQGEIVALRGLGGFQLLVDAQSDAAVQRLRERKQREQKPLAVLFPDLASVREHCELSSAEEAVLTSAARPIVLGRRRPTSELATSVAPGLSELGVFLPSTPLLGLLLAELGFPVVCTSGNLSGEPLCVDTAEALERLGAIADVFLVHDRPIARPLDDSVVRVGPFGLESIRRARGYAPLAVARFRARESVLALGAYQKCTVALGFGERLLLSQHLADLDTARGLRLLERTVDDLLGFCRVTPDLVACDLHPDYPSSTLAERLAERFGSRLVRVQHHHAHIAAVLAEHDLDEPVLGLAWDGTGLGDDRTIWGGEALWVSGAEARRLGHLGVFPLLGGDRASREPRRAALGLLWATDRARARAFARERFGEASGALLLQALERGINTPPTSSLGRLFDAVAALLGVRDSCSYEGQAAVELEALAEREPEAPAYELLLSAAPPYVAALEPLTRQICGDLEHGVDRARIAARFQASLVELGVALAGRVETASVVLGGGCFQNRYLRRRLSARLSALGRRVLTANQVPTNDGGIALGQAWVASRTASEPRD
jgi:hydrogenase maturation protein HypF